LLVLTDLPYADSRLARFLIWCRAQAALQERSWGVVTGGNPWVHAVLERLLWQHALPLFQDREHALHSLLDREEGTRERSGRSVPAEVVRWCSDAVSGEFQYVSATAEPVFGEPPGCWLADPGYLLDRIDPRDRGRWQAAWDRASREGLPGLCECRISVAGEVRRAQAVMLPPGLPEEAAPQVRGMLVLLAEPTPEQPQPRRRREVDRAALDRALLQARDAHLNAVDRAEALQRLKALSGAPWKQIAREVGLSHTYVRQLVGVLKLEHSVRERLREGRIPLRTALAIKPLPGSCQSEFADKAAEQHLSAEEIRRHPAQPPHDTPGAADSAGLPLTADSSPGETATRKRELTRAARRRRATLNPEPRHIVAPARG
jgi:hypothetical protein